MEETIVICGMQFGSEGKGKIANYLCRDANISVRVGGINAGHTLYYGGKKYAMQTIPVGWTNPDCMLVIGAGALINLDILQHEIEMIEKAGLSVRDRLFIDPAVGIIGEEHQRIECDNRMNHFNGSTCEGVGAATADRVMRRLKVAASCKELKDYLLDTVYFLNDRHGHDKIVIEGTQGFGLSLFTARQNTYSKRGEIFYPKCTSREVTPSAILADCGLSIKKYRSIGVMRSYPIRVGYDEAGTMCGKELTWEEVTKRSGYKEPLLERTTVTKRVRRISENNLSWMANVARILSLDEIAFTFVDYVEASNYGKTKYGHLTTKVRDAIKDVEIMTERPVTLISTGKSSTDIIELKKRKKWKPPMS